MGFKGIDGITYNTSEEAEEANRMVWYSNQISSKLLSDLKLLDHYKLYNNENRLNEIFKSIINELGKRSITYHTFNDLYDYFKIFSEKNGTIDALIDVAIALIMANITNIPQKEISYLTDKRMELASYITQHLAYEVRPKPKLLNLNK